MRRHFDLYTFKKIRRSTQHLKSHITLDFLPKTIDSMELKIIETKYWYLNEPEWQFNLKTQWNWEEICADLFDKLTINVKVKVHKIRIKSPRKCLGNTKGRRGTLSVGVDSRLRVALRYSNRTAVSLSRRKRTVYSELFRTTQNIKKSASSSLLF